VGNLLLYSVGNLRMWAPSSTAVFQAANGIQLQLQPKAFYADTELAKGGNPVFEMVVGSLDRIASLARQNGTTTLIVFLPSKEEVYLPLLGELPPDRASPLQEVLEQRNVPYLDLLPEFRARAARGEVLYFEVDGHPNARGYALIAELVISHLKKHAKDYGLNQRVLE